MFVAVFFAPRRLLRTFKGEQMDSYDAYLLRCEIEDIQDEMARRTEKRKRAVG